MMKHCLILSVFYANTAFAAFNPFDIDLFKSSNRSAELIVLDDLIEATEQSVDRQKELRKDIKAYQQQQQKFIKDMNDRTLASDLIQSAQDILKTIHDNHLEHLFSSEFIRELTFMSQLGNP